MAFLTERHDWRTTKKNVAADAVAARQATYRG